MWLACSVVVLESYGVVGAVWLESLDLISSWQSASVTGLRAPKIFFIKLDF